MITMTGDFIVKRTLLVPLFWNRVVERGGGGCKDENAGGAIFARRKNPPCKSLPAGVRVIGRGKERWIKGVDGKREDAERVHERERDIRSR